MEPTPPAALIQGQLEVALRLVLTFFKSLTPDEVKSIRRGIISIDHAMTFMLTAETLESEGLGPIGISFSFSIPCVH